MREFGSEKRMSLCAGGQQQRAHRSRLPGAQRRHRRTDELHGVVDRKPRRHHAAGRVDVHRDFLLRILGFEEQKLRDRQRRHAVLDRAGHEDDALFQRREKCRRRVRRGWSARPPSARGSCRFPPDRALVTQGLAEANIHRQGRLGLELPGADERPVMQDLKDRVHRYGPIPGDKTGQKRAEFGS
jgi:hypothetical protein